MDCHCWHGVHLRLCHILHVHWNVPAYHKCRAYEHIFSKETTEKLFSTTHFTPNIEIAYFYVPFPDTKTLVIWSGHETPVLVHKGNGVDSSQMSVILLHNLPWPSVPLQREEKERKITSSTLYKYTIKKYLNTLQCKHCAEFFIYHPVFFCYLHYLIVLQYYYCCHNSLSTIKVERFWYLHKHTLTV